LYQLAKKFGDDLELWEICLTALPEADPRRALAKAAVS
jgi:hypothetical protein